jgi:hypothetical protein
MNIIHSEKSVYNNQTQTKPNPNQTQTKPKPNPNQTKPKPNPNQTQTKKYYLAVMR